MAVDILDFIPGVAPAAPMCPTKIIKERIIEALRLFCHETKLWTVQLEEQGLTKDVAKYDVTAMNELSSGTAISTVGEVVAIDHVELNGLALETTSEAYLNEMERGWRSHTEPKPRRFYMGPSREIVFVYTPSLTTADGLDLFLSLKPLWSATQVEDWFYNDWKKAIEYAAQAYLLEIPKMAWTDPAGAGYFWQKFNEQLDDAYDHKAAGYGDHQAAHYMRPDRRYV